MIDSICTRTTILARIRSTFIDVGCASRANKSRNTSTRESIDSVNTAGAVLAKVSNTIIDISLTEKVSEAKRANAGKTVQNI
jgi:hypothetical protein